MGKYANLKFFDGNSDELNLVYDETNEIWGGIVYLPEVSVGLYETLSIYMFEEVKGTLNETKYITPITQESSGSTKLILNFIDEYDSSSDISLYSTNLVDGEFYVEHEDKQITALLPTSTIVGNVDGINTVSSDVKNSPIQINIALNSEDEQYHTRVLRIFEADSNGITTHEIANIKVYGETVGEDERLQDLLTNIGMSIKPTDYLIFEDSDLKENGIDWKLINRKRRELLLEASNIKPFIGTYKAILNVIKYFGYENLTLKEYWLNINEQAERFGKLKAVAVPNQEVKGFLSSRGGGAELPNSNLKKTSKFSLVYRLNNFTGEFDNWDLPKVKEVTDFTPDEVLVKLYGLKKKLHKEFLPMQSKIVDIVGEADYFSQFNINTWNNQQNIQTQNAGVDLMFDIVPSNSDIYIEDLRKVDGRLTGIGQDFELLANTDFSYGIQGHWRMGEDDVFPMLTDFTGNGNNGTMQNMTASDIVTTTSPKNNSTKCTSFDGIDDGVSVVTGDGLNPTKALTVNTWIQMDDWTGGANPTDNHRILSCHDDGGFGLMWNNKRISGSARINGTGGGQSVWNGYNKMSNNSGTGYYANSDGWHMVTLSFDGRYLRLYVDGEQHNDGGANQDQAIAYNTGQSSHTKDFFSVDGNNNEIEYSTTHPHDIIIGAEPTHNAATNITTMGEFFHGLIDDTTIWSRALLPTEIYSLYNDMVEIKTNLNNSVNGSIETFYNEYNDINMSTFNDFDGGPIGAPIILKGTNSLPKSWDSALFSINDAKDSYNDVENSISNLMTWDNWWTRNVYEVEWRLIGPNNYDRTFRGPTDDFLEFALTLPYPGKYSIEMALYDLYNVRSVMFMKDEIEILQKNIEIYGMYRSLNEEPEWDLATYNWNISGGIWDLAGENETKIEDSLATYYLTLDRANYIHDDSDGWEFSTTEVFGEPNGYLTEYTSGPYAWSNLNELNWTDGPTTSWDMTNIFHDENAAFFIEFNQFANTSINNILSISRKDNNGVLQSEVYSILTTLPADHFDLINHQNLSDELNTLDSSIYPILSSFNFNPIFEDTNNNGTYNECFGILSVSKLATSSYDFDSASLTGSMNNLLKLSVLNHHTSNNPKYNDAKIIASHDTVNKFNHLTFSFDNSKAPGIIEHEWTIENNTKSIDDIYYSNKWLTYAFTSTGDYTISLKTKDVNGNINTTNKNILTII
jgi:hypothetical protein